jgi:hypothetical protein
MGFDINIHDQFACESQGPIADRTKENLGSTDKGIVLYRRILLDAINKNEAGEKPLMVLDEEKAVSLKGPVTVDGIGPTDGMDDYWKESDARRRAQVGRRESGRVESSPVFVCGSARRSSRQDPRRLRSEGGDR